MAKKPETTKKIDVTDLIRNRWENRLKKILNIKYLKYNKDPEFGEVGAWILLSSRGVESAARVIVDKGSPIYIHAVHGSASFKWNYYDQEWVVELWRNQEKVEEKKVENIDELKIRMKKYWRFCKYKDTL